ncbi:MAG: hypothetical protein J6R26_06305 [Paludibacteraceae bacterium]|nr:hypothetical protein [Paludibacteraceae bacterium]
MAQRKSINFNVSQETYDQVKELFPDVVGTEDNLKQLLSAYRFHIEHKNDSVDINLQLEEVRSDLNDKVADLQRAEAHGQALQQQLNELGNKTNEETASLQEQIRTLEEQNMSLASVISERDTTIAELQEKHPTWAQIRVTLQPFTVALIEETARRLSEKYGRTIAPMSILTDMFLRYTIERWNEWFYKFCLNDREILAIAQEINPDIKSIDQVKKAVCK